MSFDIAREAIALEMDVEPSRAIFDIANENEHLLDEIARQTPQIYEALASVRRQIPLPRSAAAGISGRFYRLPNHNRSYCCSLMSSGALFDAPVLVFKGCEPLLRDFEVLLEWMSQAPIRTCSRVIADHFPLAEGKIPGALSLKEAVRESEIALNVQKRHLTRYGQLASVPTPLLIHALSNARRDECIELLHQRLSAEAFDRIEPLMRNGLAIYIYFYPSAPIRANYWGDTSLPELSRFVVDSIDEDHAALGWARLLIRLLYLGYLPYSVRNEGLGACMDFGNATLDGGFCDLDSIVEIEENMDDEFFAEGVVQSINFLRNTIQMMLGGTGSSSLYSGIEEFVFQQYVGRILNDAVASEARPGLGMDRRFSGLMNAQSISDVKQCLSRKNRTALYTHYARRQGQQR